jgi:phospholipase C
MRPCRPPALPHPSLLPWLAALLLGGLCPPLQTQAAPKTGQNSSDAIQTIVVIYGENRSFDNLYGLFPGANGVAQATSTGRTRQTGPDGKELPYLPPVWLGKAPEFDSAYPKQLPNGPFRIDTPPVNLGLEHITRDLVHRFYQHQMQINGGKNDRFAAISNAGALTMGFYDGSKLPLWQLARQYTLADQFFMGAFGGSFLNHMWLACACTPQFADAPEKMRVQLNPDGTLKRKPDSPASPLDGPPQFFDGSVTPDGFAVNTVQPPYQPSEIAPAAGQDVRLADPGHLPLPPQSQKTLGDALSERNISWAWYAAGWNTALQDRTQIYDSYTNFQSHHQPYNYFSRYAPGTPERAQHLKDGQDLGKDIAQGKLPQVVFYKPSGPLNQHPGYASVINGDIHIAELIKTLQASKQWPHMAIIVTYDENGGFWDHVAPPAGDRFGPGSRVPTLIISPFAKRHFVDHTPYDTTSILQFISKRFGLTMLPGIRKQMGDLSNAFELK